MTTEILIGTSGWHYPHWRGIYYPPHLPAGRWLAHYAQAFDTVEINNTFYRLPTEHTVDGWVNSAPNGFRFAVKASRFITHRKKLLDPQPALARLLPLLQRFGDKLGPVLFQLPPAWRVNPTRLATFLDALPAGLEYAFELRDPSWHCEEVYALLRQHGIAFCIYDIGGFCSPLIVTSDISYVRLHGPEAPYCGSYPAHTLQTWVTWLKERNHLKRVYVFFDNDQAGYAVQNALALKELLGQL